jgi:cytochrome c553
MGCHGPHGEGDPANLYPRVTDQHYLYLLRQMRDMRGGKRRNANPEMWEVSKTYPDEDIQVVIDYIPRLQPD